MSGWDVDRWDGAMVGPFFVGSDALPHGGHTTIRADDPDLAVVGRYEYAQDVLRGARTVCDDLSRDLLTALAAGASDAEIDRAVLRTVAAVLRAGGHAKRAVAQHQGARAAWAEVVHRRGFRDGMGVAVDMPKELADLLPQPGPDQP